MNILVRAPVEGEALGPAKTEPPVNMIVGGEGGNGGRMGRGSSGCLALLFIWGLGPLQALPVLSLI